MIDYLNASAANMVKNSEYKLKNLNRKQTSTTNGPSFNDQLEKVKLKSNEKKDQKLWDTSVEMESLFVNNMFKEMRKTIHKSNWNHGGHAEEIFEDMLYDKYSLQVSKNSNLGLAKMIYEQMSNKI